MASMPLQRRFSRVRPLCAGARSGLLACGNGEDARDDRAIHEARPVETRRGGVAAVAALSCWAGTGVSVMALPTRAATTRAATPSALSAPAAVAAQTPTAPGGCGFANFINHTMGPGWHRPPGPHR